MNLNDLSKSIELTHVNSEFGFGEEIEYNTLHTVTPPTLVNAFVGIVKQNVLGKLNTVTDDLQFSSVELSFTPKQGDKITLNGKVWYVMSWTQTNPYDIMATRNKSHIGSRTTRRTS